MSTATSPILRVRLFHLFALQNLGSICSERQLFSKNQMSQKNLDFRSIAHENIQSRRARTVVPLESGGTLHDYVPFYFASRSPMLSAIKHGRVDSYDDSQETLGYLVTTVGRIVEAGLPFVFTRRNATLINAEFHNELEQLQATIDWEVMKRKYWGDTLEDGDAKARRQAEFLVLNGVPLNVFAGIAVYSDAIKDNIINSIDCSSLPIKAQPNWYF